MHKLYRAIMLMDSMSRNPMHSEFHHDLHGDRTYRDHEDAPMKHSGEKSKKHHRKMDLETAEEWVSEMKNEDGTRGAHWNYEQIQQMMQQKNIDCDPIEFFVAANMMYSDYCKVAKQYNLNTVDFYFAMAAAFLDDKDAEGDKIVKYYEHIANE